MALYHFTVKVMSRTGDRNAVSGATYRHGQSMTDEKTGKTFINTTQQDVEHCEISVPEEAPAWAHDLTEGDVHKNSEKLWNAVEQFEKRKDAQLYREVEFALPHELTSEQRLELARAFIKDTFVSKGMIADWAVHNHFDKEEGIEKPHVHVMLTMRELEERSSEGFVNKLKSFVGIPVSSSDIAFGQKVREWNSKSVLLSWRETWADYANTHLDKAGLDVRIDHRSYEDQGIELEPQPKLGKAVSEMSQRGLPMDRFQEMMAVQQKNRALIRKNPEIVLDYITRYQSTFTRQDIAKLLNRYIDNAEEFQTLLSRIEASSKIVTLTGTEDERSVKLTTHDVIRLEKKIVSMGSDLSSTPSCPVTPSAVERLLEKGHDRLKEHGGLSPDQVHAIRHVVADGQLKSIVGYAGAGKTTCLEVAKEIWESAGYTVVGAAPTGKAASNLEAIGISSKTLHKWDYEWSRDRDQLGKNSVLILDEAGMVDNQRLHDVLKQSQKKGFKVVLVGDPEQLPPIEAGAPARAILETTGFANLSTIVRQHWEWHKEASRDLATRQTEKALETYHQNRCVHYSAQAKEDLIKDWSSNLQESGPQKASSLILAYTNQEVKELNQLARREIREVGLLQGSDQIFTISKPMNLEMLDKTDMHDKSFKPKMIQEERRFAKGDQIVFLRNDYNLNVRNGQLGKIVDIQEGIFSILKDDKKQVTFDMGLYNHIDYGYATTIHKSQGTTVDKVYLHASPNLNKHLTYVALTRHRDEVQVYANTDTLPNKAALIQALSKDVPKENALDYLLDNNQPLELSQEDKKAFMQRRSLSGSQPSSLSWDALKNFTHKAWAQTKEWAFGRKTEDRSFSPAQSTPKDQGDRDFLKEFQKGLKERASLPPILYRSQEQKQNALKIGEKLDELGHKIFNTPDLMKSAISLGIESAIKVSASSFSMKLSQAKEKGLGLGRSIGF